MKLCTWHDSCAVVACEKFCNDIIPCNGVTLKPIFHRISFTMEKSFVKWALLNIISMICISKRGSIMNIHKLQIFTFVLTTLLLHYSHYQKHDFNIYGYRFWRLIWLCIKEYDTNTDTNFDEYESKNCTVSVNWIQYSDVIMNAMASQITSLTIVYSTIYSGADQRKHQSPALVALCTGQVPAQRATNAENVSVWWHHHVRYDLDPDYICIPVLVCVTGPFR